MHRLLHLYQHHKDLLALVVLIISVIVISADRLARSAAAEPAAPVRPPVIRDAETFEVIYLPLVQIQTQITPVVRRGSVKPATGPVLTAALPTSDQNGVASISDTLVLEAIVEQRLDHDPPGQSTSEPTPPEPTPEKAGWGQPFYYFPYPAGPVKITRGGLGHFNGSGPAYDFAGGVDTPVVAARAGTVVRANYGTRDAECSSEEPPNQVVIDHGDGTYGVYLHFAHNRPILRLGDKVAIGTILGYTGCTGRANGPHVHFHVTDRFNPDDPQDDDHLTRRLNIWFYEAGPGDLVPPINVYPDKVQFIDSLNPIKDTLPPVGEVLNLVDGGTVAGPLPIKGWALDNTTIDRIELWLDGQSAGNAKYDRLYIDPTLDCGGCGFSAEIDTSQYAPGGHVLTVKIYDRAGNYREESWYLIFAR